MAQSAPRRTGVALLSSDEAKALVARVLSFSAADETRVNISSTLSGNTRFAEGQITTSGDIADTTVRVTATSGRRRASATTNALDETALKEVAELALRLARLSPEDPELMPELGPQTFSTVNGFIDRTVNLTAEARAMAVKRTIDTAFMRAKTAGSLSVAGFLSTNAGASAVATSKGLLGYHRSTDVDFSTTVRTADGTGSGWARVGARDWGVVDPATLGGIAADKAIASRNPQPLEPGKYTVVLEPQAVTDLLPLLVYAFDARSANEGRSAFSAPNGATKIGEKIADERVTLYSDPADPDVLGQPFDAEGVAIRRQVWIEKGILKNLSYSRYWAQKQGVPAPGALGDDLAVGLKLTGGSKTTEDLIAGCERGILVTHFFYIRGLDRRTVLFTGLTRDGTFLIEHGKVIRALKNFRWNESPLGMLNRLEEIGRPERTVPGLMMPALRVRDFHFTSLSDAV
jgi:predicted Zn-dependent protease